LLNLNLSLSNFRTDYALALKGSIAFVLGRREEAMTLWYQAKQRNPMLIIPEMKYLEKIRQEVRAEIGADTAWLPNIPNLLDTGIVIRPDWLLELENKMVERQNAPETQNRTAPMALLEGELGNRVGQAVKGFMEAQEFFYRGMLEEAEASADASLRFFKTDHALALKGSIAFLNGRKEEAERWWLEAQQGNPEILIPLQDFLQKIKDQVIDLQPSKPQD
jgi:tetratricopeptide (TPR) repeat protein